MRHGNCLQENIEEIEKYGKYVLLVKTRAGRSRRRCPVMKVAHQTLYRNLGTSSDSSSAADRAAESPER